MTILVLEMQTLNPGAAALNGKLSERGAKSEFARRIGVDLGVVSRWCSGERLPDTKNRALIEDLLGISWRLWDEEPPKGDEQTDHTEQGVA